MGFVRHFGELKVYQLGFDAAMSIFQLTKKWPLEERFALTGQIRRPSRGVCGNIAEAWRKRRYPSHFVSKLTDADGEAAETENWLKFALECEYITDQEHTELRVVYTKICGGLVDMMRNCEQWCGPATLVKESAAEYIITPQE